MIKSNLNGIKLARKVKSLAVQHAKKEKEGYNALYLERIIKQIERLKKLVGKPAYVSKFIVSHPNELGQMKPVGAVSYGPAIKETTSEGVKYNSLWKEPRNIRFI